MIYLVSKLYAKNITPLHFACQSGNLKLVKYIQSFNKIDIKFKSI